jgi:hypothetical protein
MHRVLRENSHETKYIGCEFVAQGSCGPQIASCRKRTIARPSGFLILADGRCLALRWRYYDLTLRAVAESLQQSQAAHTLRQWLLTLLPGPYDIVELGHGAWLRSEDQQVIRRHLDVRELTPENQRLFHEAALRAGNQARAEVVASKDAMLAECLVRLSDMVGRANRGEPPLNLSDWTTVEPPQKTKVGPGWDDIDCR